MKTKGKIACTLQSTTTANTESWAKDVPSIILNFVKDSGEEEMDREDVLREESVPSSTKEHATLTERKQGVQNKIANTSSALETLPKPEQNPLQPETETETETTLEVNPTIEKTTKMSPKEIF